MASVERAAIAVDLGGTNLRAALVDERGRVFDLRRRRSPSEEDWSVGVGQISDLVRELADPRNLALHSLDYSRIVGVGVGSPGPQDGVRGIVYSSPNLPRWRNVPLASALRDSTRFPVWIENDADTAALAEARWGAGKRHQHFIYLAIGTGLGGSLIINGQPWHGANGIGAELGHITVEAHGRPCTCGNHGCWESYVSGWSLVERAKERAAATQSPPAWAQGKIEPRSIAEAAEDGESLALALFEESARYLGIGIASLTNALNPDLVVIGGGVAAAWDLWIKPAREELRWRAFNTQAESVRIVRAEMAEPGLSGAAALAYLRGGVPDQE